MHCIRIPKVAKEKRTKSKCYSKYLLHYICRTQTNYCIIKSVGKLPNTTMLVLTVTHTTVYSKYNVI